MTSAKRGWTEVPKVNRYARFRPETDHGGHQKRKGLAADAKEVGVKNPAEETFCCPDPEIFDTTNIVDCKIIASR
jgi:hypothetical protein